MPAKLLTNQQEDAIVQFYQEHDWSVPEVAKHFGISKYPLDRALRKRDIARHVTHRGTRLAQRREMTEEERNVILQMWNDGRSLDAICKTVGVHARTMKRWFVEDLDIEYVKRVPRRENRSNWIGGRFLTHYGYVMVWVDDADLWCFREDQSPAVNKGRRYMLEHRLMMAKHIGRPLAVWEEVHHINGDRTDNRIENLQLRQIGHGCGQQFVCNYCGSHDISPIEV